MNEYSDILDMPCGVPQGSVIGPILYTIYCSDIPKFGICEYAFYADNICAIFVSDVFAENILNELQNGVDSLTRYFQNWKIKINANKTQAIYFTRKRNACFVPKKKKKKNYARMPWSEKNKYHTHHLHTKLTFAYHVKKKKK